MQTQTQKVKPYERKPAEGSAEIVAARQAAAMELTSLFVSNGQTAEGKPLPGALHQHSITTLETVPQWAVFLDHVRKNPHAKTLAMVASARGDKNFPPALVAELFSDENRNHDPRWFAEVFLGGLADIAKQTGVVVMLPPNQAGLDMKRAAFNVVSHLREEERTKLGLTMPDEAPRRQFATDLAGILAETTKPTTTTPTHLTPAQQLYRWAMYSWAEREERRSHNQSTSDKLAEDPAGALPVPPASTGTAASIPTVPGTAASTAPSTAGDDNPQRRRGSTTTRTRKPAEAATPTLPATPPTPAAIAEVPPAPVPIPAPVEALPPVPVAEVSAAPVPSLPPVPAQAQVPAAVPANTEMNFETFAGRLKRVSAKQETKIELIAAFRKNKAEAIETLETMEAMAT